MTEQSGIHTTLHRVAKVAIPTGMATATVLGLGACSPEQTPTNAIKPAENIFHLDPSKGMDAIKVELSVDDGAPIPVEGFTVTNRKVADLVREFVDDEERSVVHPDIELSISKVPNAPFVLRALNPRVVEITKSSGNGEETTVLAAKQDKDNEPQNRAAGRDLYLGVQKSVKGKNPSVPQKSEGVIVAGDLTISAPDGLTYASSSSEGIVDGKTVQVEGFRFLVNQGTIALTGAPGNVKYTIFPISETRFLIRTDKGDLIVTSSSKSNTDGTHANIITEEKIAPPPNNNTPPVQSVNK